ncbi:MAG: DUF4173 domain-containing protein [Actinomycetota bacterium]
MSDTDPAASGDVDGPGPAAAVEAPPTPVDAGPPIGPPQGPPGQLGSRGPAAPFWAVEDEPRRLGWQFWLAIALGAVATDIGLRQPPWNNVAASAAVVAVVIALLTSGRIRDVSAQVALGLAAVLGLFLWLRTNPALVVFDLLAIAALIWVAVVHSRGRSLWQTTPFRLLVRGAETIVMAGDSLPVGGGELIARRRKRRASSGRTGDTVAGLARGAMIAVPVLVVLGLLLASADAVFASFFNFDVSVGTGFGSGLGHGFLLLLGAATMVVLLRLSARNLSNSDELNTAPRLGLVETMVVLVSLDVLFAAFGVAQLMALSGGADEVIEEAGLTVKEYARQGFFQLLWVAGLTAMVLIVLDVVSRHHRPRGRRLVRAASLVAVGLTFVIVAVAYSRLRLYIDFDGHTPLRFYSSVFSLWIAVVFVILAVRIVGFRSSINWFTAAVGTSAVVFLIGLNVANPEALIVESNLARSDGQIIWHMDQFSADGNVVLAAGIDRLPADVQPEVREKFCIDAGRDVIVDDEHEGAHRGLGYNRAERRLDAAQARLCALGG